MMKPERVWVIASNVFLEVIRDRILYLVALFALLMVIATGLLPEIAAGTEDKLTLDLGLAAINVFALVVVVFIGTGLINKEIEKRTVLVLIAKPVRRLEFIIGKHLGLSAVIAVLLLLLTVIYIGVLSANQIAFSLASLLLAALFMFLEMMLLTAFAILFGVFTSSLLATLLTFAIYLMGHLSRDIVALGKLADDPNIQRITDATYLILPDLARLNLKNQAVYGLQLLPNSLELASHALYAFLYTVLLIVLSIMIFSRRQF